MTCYEKVYHVFSEGDEVYTEKIHYKSIRPNRPYTVLKCYKPPGFIEGYPVIMIDLMTDGGYVSRFATDRFIKTSRQLREDKIKSILY